MCQASVSGAGLSGLAAPVLEALHLKALDSTMAFLLRRMAGGRMSWIEEVGATRCYANKQLFRRWRTPRCSTAQRIRRLRWQREWAIYPEDFGSALAA
eukprot:2059292-Pyramimonas_sp.AAC.1